MSQDDDDSRCERTEDGIMSGCFARAFSLYFHISL